MGAPGKLARGLLYAKGLRIGNLGGFERLIAGIYGTPDRVPVLCQPYTYAMAMHGLSAHEFFTQPRTLVHASSNMANYFGFDFFKGNGLPGVDLLSARNALAVDKGPVAAA